MRIHVLKSYGGCMLYDAEKFTIERARELYPTDSKTGLPPSEITTLDFDCISKDELIDDINYD